MTYIVKQIENSNNLFHIHGESKDSPVQVKQSLTMYIEQQNDTFC